MSYGTKTATLSVQLPALLDKMRSNDSDLRTMALIDLNKDLTRVTAPAPSTSTPFSSSRRPTEAPTYADDYTEKEITTMVLKLLADPIAEVKNMTVSSLGLMVRRARTQYLALIVNDLLAGVGTSDKENESNEGRRDISCLALKSVILEMPSEGQQVAVILDTIVAKVYPLLTKPNPDSQLASELLQILADIYHRFPHIITTSTNIQKISLTSLIKILTTAKPSIRKRAIPALSALIATNPKLFDGELKSEIIKGLNTRGEGSKTWSGVIANLARGASVMKVGGMVGDGKVVDAVLGQMEDLEDVDAVEGALGALEVLVLRCPTEITSYVPAIQQKALELIKYDPNYAEFSDDDVDMDGNEEDEDEDDDFDEEAYADDEDMSWKIRRSSAKLLNALIGTRNELLSDFYKSTAPTLITRFSEREESVRLEVLSTFEVLLKQTSTAKAAELASGGRNKRKWSEGMDEEADDSISQQLRGILPQAMKGLLKQLNSKSIPTRHECFIILRLFAEILQGGLETQANTICTATVSALRTIDSSASALAIAALSFLSVFFKTHSGRCYVGHLKEIVPVIVRCMKDKLSRINFEAFAAASALAQAVRPQGNASPLNNGYSEPIKKIFNATTDVLADTTVDGEVRERALEALGSLLVHEGDLLSGSYGVCLPLITARLANESTASTAVLVIGKVAESPICDGPQFNSWLLEVLPEMVTALRRSRRSTSRGAEFSCLQNVLNRVGKSLSPQSASKIINDLKPFIDTPTALQVIGLILEQQPTSRSSIDDTTLKNIFEIIKTPSVNPHVLEALVIFFKAYVDGDIDCSTRLVPSLIDNLGKAGSGLPDATAGGTSIYATTAKVVGVVVERSERNAAGVLAMFQKTINSSKSKEADVYLALLAIGEIGRNLDLSGNTDMFQSVLQFFENDSEEVRSAAAFAAGNLAVGSPNVFLPAIIKHIETASTEASRVLLLHALKEVILHSPTAQLEALADSLWKPLFADDAAVSGDVAMSGGSPTAAAIGTPGAAELGDDGVRNVKAACIGKLTTTAPGKFLPQLQHLLKSTPRNRAIVAAAVRYTFIDTSSAYDELIAPIIVDFLSLMHDENLIVRRLSLASLNAAIQNKPHLIIDRLSTLQPLLYQETVVRPELKREVKMGPFKIIEDDGLENRKTAYEAMYTLLATCFNKIDLPSFTDRVMAALQDVNEVKVLGLMLLLRLGQLAPTTVIPRLDDAAESLKVMMKDVEVKEDTIKQDLERKEEMQRSALRTAVPLYKMSSANQAPIFHQLVAGLLASQQWKEFKDYQG